MSSHQTGNRGPGTGSTREDARQRAHRLWRAHRRWIAAIVLAHKPREADLEDLLQTVAMQVVRGIGAVEQDDATERAWLRTVAANAARAAGRKATVRRKGLRLVREREIERSRSEHGGDSLDSGRRLMELARSLPEGYREPLVLRCVKGMSYRQIAEATGLPETTIETRIARGRRMLRKTAEIDEQAGITGTAEERAALAGGA